jgi:hypothetical protein
MKLFQAQRHDFHLVRPSTLPATISIPIMITAFVLLIAFAGDQFDEKIGFIFIALIITIIS